MKLLHFISFCLIYLYFLYPLYGQEGNYVFKHNNLALLFTESTWIGDTLLIAGTLIDSFGFVKNEINFVDSGLNNFILTNDKLDTSDLFDYCYFSKGLAWYDDTIYQVGYKYFETDTTPSGSVLYGILNKFDKYGNKLSELILTGKYFPAEHFARPNDIVIDIEYIIITYLTFHYVAGKRDAQICLLKLSKSGDIIVDECYGDANRDVSTNIFTSTSGDIMTLGYSDNFYFGNLYLGKGNGYSRGYIFNVSSNGQINWEWRSESKFETAKAGYLENDSILVVAGGHAIEDYDPDNPSGWCQFLWAGNVYKMNLNNRTKIWDTSLMGGPYNFEIYNQFLDIIPSIEKDGYIVCGSGNVLAYEGCAEIDTQKCWSHPGVIAKVSNDGDSLWLRKYFGLTDVSESNVLYDAEITPDGGYSFVGEAFGATKGQHGWILKTDSQGCLFPGCHLISSNEDPKKAIPVSSFTVYPNPVIDNINLLITKSISVESYMVLSDMSGRIVDSWNTFELGGTYIIPCSYAPGIYMISLIDSNNRPVESQKVYIK